MATSKRYVEIALDKPRRIKFTINAMREVEQDFGLAFNKIFDPKDPTVSVDQIIRMLFFGLKHGDQSNRKDIPTVDRLGDVLQKHWIEADKGGWADLMEYIIDGMKAGGIIPEDVNAEAEEVPADDDPLAGD